MHVHTLQRVCSQMCMPYTGWCQNTCIAHTPAYVLVLKTSVLVHATLTAKNVHAPTHARLCNGAAKKIPMETIANFSRILKLRSDWRQTKQIQLNHGDALGEPNVQRRACWVNTQTDCAASVRQPIQPPVFVTASRHPVRENMKIHAIPWCSRSCIVAHALSIIMRHHPASQWPALTEPSMRVYARCESQRRGSPLGPNGGFFKKVSVPREKKTSGQMKSSIFCRTR